VIEIIKALPEFRRECSIPKLFSKHIKLEEQTEVLSAEQVCIAVGTPARLEKLVSVDALHLERVTLLLIDCQRDIKQRCMLDIPETRRDFWALWRTHLATRVAQGRIKVGLFE
jgi:protein CMS1